MGRRREPRQQLQCNVRVLGTDANGRPFSQNTQTVDISRGGVRIAAMASPLKIGDVIALSYKQQKARFRVIWSQAPELGGQAGLQAVTPELSIWDFPLPPPGMDEYGRHVAAERRTHARMRCSGSAELRPAGHSAPILGSVVEISEGGCFVEMPIPLPKTTPMKITLWLNQVKVVGEAEVSNSRPGFGMGLRFTELAEPERQKIIDYINALPRSPFPPRR